MSESKRFWLLLIAPAALLYSLLLPRYYVGWFIDDATYINAATALLQGHYVSLHDPRLAPLTQFPPGYPLFLTPFVKLVMGHWTLLRIPSLVCTVLSLHLTWKLLEGWRPPYFRWIIAAALAFNPAVLTHSGLVLSEPLYLFLSLLSFMLLRTCLAPRSPGWVPWTLGAILGWAALTRTIGILLIPCVIGPLILTRHWKILWRVLPCALLPVLGWWVRNARHAVAGTEAHFNLFQNSLSALWRDGGAAWIDHLNRLGYNFFSEGVTGLAMPYTGWAITLNLCIVISLLGFFMLGVKSLLEKRNAFRPLGIGMALYVTAYLMVFAFWLAIDIRFVFPILPFMAIFIVEGIQRAFALFRWPRIALLGLGGIFILSYTYRDFILLKEVYEPPVNRVAVFPGQTYQWINSHLPKDTLLLTTRPSTLFLYTRRTAITSVRATDIEEFRYRLLNRGVRYALIQPTPVVEVKGLLHPNRQNQRWIMGWPAAFPIVYQNPEEQPQIHRIEPDPKYQEAYRLYMAAAAALANGQVNESLRQLDHVLKLYPELSNAHNAYGLALMSSNKNLEKAEKHFKQALAIRPYSPMALYNLGRLYQQRGQPSRALETYEKALSAISISLESAALEPDIRAAKNTIEMAQK